MVNWKTVPAEPTAALIVVTNISAQATEKIVRDFFLFCGKIKSFEMQKSDTDDTKTALVLFERDSAAKTACVLSNALIVDSQITVKQYFDVPSVPASPTAAESASATGSQQDVRGAEPLRQEEKPKASVVSEILAAGYGISEQIIERAKDLDTKYQVTGRFQTALNQAKGAALAIDEKYKIHENIQSTAKSLDTKFHVSEKAQMVEQTAKSLAEQALATPTGQRVASVVTQAQTKVQQVHGEARHIADEKKQAKSPVTAAPAAAATSPTE